MSTLAELKAAWQERRTEWSRFGVQLSGEKIAAQVLAELEELERSQGEELLTLDDAAQESGYNADSLARMIRQGKIPNAGERRRPRIRRCDLPRRPGRATGRTTIPSPSNSRGLHQPGTHTVASISREALSRKLRRP